MITAETLRTPRLTLLPLLVEHAEEMTVVLSDPGLHRFIGGEPLGAGELRARYGGMAAGSGDPGVGWLNWVLRLEERGCLVGTVQATVTAGEHGSTAEIAWVLGTPWQGCGLAAESARALVGWLRERSVAAVIAHVHPDHRASAAVATAAGLVPTEEWQDGEVRWHLP
ncbi:GNAT family N-acetyltransferase [Kitasatospora sp. CMC57]|uniref:GNAT family N-acetyltransferase n=1 Tax=Kitasatospora sp. CMC57 TaxID=3231513 RepID=A0AB33JMF4_9ACTN